MWIVRRWGYYMVWKNGRCFSKLLYKLFGGGKRYNKKFLAIWPEGNCFVYISYKGVNIGINLSFVFLFVFVFVFWKLGHETWSSARMYQVVSEAKWCSWWRSQPKIIFRRILVRRLFSGELLSKDYFQEDCCQEIIFRRRATRWKEKWIISKTASVVTGRTLMKRQICQN